MISRETIEEILLRTDIQTLIGGYVTLKRASANLKGLCPFHSEKSPSFTVYPANNSYYCFGCGAGGDQINFIMRMERLDYPDAVEFLAKRAGITEIIICEENRRNIEAIPEMYLKGLTFHYVNDIKEVLEIALLKEKVKNHINLMA